MDIKNTIVTKSELAEFIGVNANTITKFIKEGMPTISNKQVNLKECIDWYIDRTKQSAQKTTQNDARTKLIEMQTKRIRLQILEKRGDLVEIDQVKITIQKLIETIKNRINTLTTKLPPKLEGKTQVQIGVILKEDIKKTLGDLDV